MTIEEYLIEVAAKKHATPDWRMGQTFLNVLHDVKHELCVELSGSEVDPFYDDNLIADFLVYVWLSW